MSINMYATKETNVIANTESDKWRKETNSIIAKICKALNDYKTPRDKIYRKVEARSKCKLRNKLNDLTEKQFYKGMSPSKIKKLNYLDAIASDDRLRDIYIEIVKEMAKKHGIRY